MRDNIRSNYPKWDPKNPVGPFDRDGNLQHYPLGQGYGAERTGPSWRAVPPWTGVLTLKGYSRGRSAAYAVFVDAHGFEYPMMLSDFVELVKERTLAHGDVYARWALAKRGQNYGIRLAKEGE